MTTPTLPRTAARSAQLVAASDRPTLDPFREIDWGTPIDDSAFHLPPEVLPLYATRAWYSMTQDERITYSRHETSAMCGAAIWFENALMQIVLADLIAMPTTDPSHRYLLVEIADECRHSMMFGEYIRRSGTPAYGPKRPLGPLGTAGGSRVLSYLLILAVEEFLDSINRLTMRDDRLHPVSRQIAKLHVLEEARHVSFAKTFLAEFWPTIEASERDIVRANAAELIASIIHLNLDPAVYAHLGIDDGMALAESNPCYRATLIAGLSKLTGFCNDIGIIDEAHRQTWEILGLVDTPGD